MAPPHGGAIVVFDPLLQRQDGRWRGREPTTRAHNTCHYPPMGGSRKALITGVTGQDGSYLTEHLLSMGYEVHGIVRRSSSFNTARIDHLYEDPHEPDVKLFTHHGDLSDPVSLTHRIYDLQPDEIYNLGAQSHVRCFLPDPGVHAST